MTCFQLEACKPCATKPLGEGGLFTTPSVPKCKIVSRMILHFRMEGVLLFGSWSIWSERNARIHGENGRAMTDSVNWPIDVAMDLATILHKVTNQVKKTKLVWEPPAAAGTLEN